MHQASRDLSYSILSSWIVRYNKNKCGVHGATISCEASCCRITRQHIHLDEPTLSSPKTVLVVFACLQLSMALMHEAHESSPALTGLRLPTELLAEIIRQISERSHLALLCRTSRALHDLAAPELYKDIKISYGGSNANQRASKLRRTQLWCRTVLESKSKAVLVRNVLIVWNPRT